VSSRLLSPRPFEYQTPPPFEKLVGDLSGAYSRRISIQHRLVDQVLDEAETVKVLRRHVDAPRVGRALLDLLAQDRRRIGRDFREKRGHKRREPIRLCRCHSQL
jgi:hypothetical protein